MNNKKKNGKGFRKSVILFDKKSNKDVRRIRFKNSKEFEHFLEAFRLMRYPGYDWRFV
jgi:hypothetical protein